ncbi:MAG: Flp pilus assembly protein CpaB [Micavibrio sp.]|nr:Flp pilus assembly protein CpaB [Micavibrio sp.]
MNKRMVIILASGLMISMLMAIFVQALMRSGSSQNKVEISKKDVLVASQHINIGDDLSDDKMTWQAWPSDLVFDGAIIRQENQAAGDALQGRVVRVIQKGEPILPTALIAETDGNFLAARLNDGMRATAIKVSAESSVGGFVTPGDYVDVILTYQVRVPSSNDGAQERAAEYVSRNASQTVLENIRVLAVDQDAKSKESAKIARTVTLEVDQKGSEVLALSSSMGDLSLALRKLGDTSHTEKKTDLTTDVLISNVLQQLNQSQNNSGNNAVRVYNGADVQQQMIRARIVPQQ